MGCRVTVDNGVEREKLASQADCGKAMQVCACVCAWKAMRVCVRVKSNASVRACVRACVSVYCVCTHAKAMRVCVRACIAFQQCVCACEQLLRTHAKAMRVCV